MESEFAVGLDGNGPKEVTVQALYTWTSPGKYLALGGFRGASEAALGRTSSAPLSLNIGQRSSRK
jgi:hypothetical protein